MSEIRIPARDVRPGDVRILASGARHVVASVEPAESDGGAPRTLVTYVEGFSHRPWSSAVVRVVRNLDEVEHVEGGDEIPVEDDGHADEFVETHAPQAHPAILGAGAAAGEDEAARQLCFRQQKALREAYKTQAAGGNAFAIVSNYLKAMRESEPATAPSESIEEG